MLVLNVIESMAIILTMEFPDRAPDMWEEFKLDFAEQHLRKIKTTESTTNEFKIAINETLYDLNLQLSAHGKTNKDFHIPMPIKELRVSKLRHEEIKYFENADDWLNQSMLNQKKMNEAQKNAFDTIMGEFSQVRRNDGFFAFVDETFVETYVSA